MIVIKKLHMIIILSLVLFVILLAGCKKTNDPGKTPELTFINGTTDIHNSHTPVNTSNSSTDTVTGSNTPEPTQEYSATNSDGTTSTPTSAPTKTPTPKPTPTPTPQTVVVFSKQGGFYDSAINVTLQAPSGYTIYYTTDGTDPLINGKVYNNVSIPTFSSETAAIGLITRNIGNYGQSKKMTATVIRAYAKKGSLITPVISNTYFVVNKLSTLYGLPFISIMLQPTDFQGSGGIYNKPSISNNLFDTKRRIEVFAEFYDEKGVKRDGMYAEMALQGNGSMGATMKSFRLYFKKALNVDTEFYPSKLKYDIFQGRVKDNNGKTIDSFKRILLRNSGNDYSKTMLRDRLMQKLSEKLNVDYQESRPSMVYINGEFWGMYNARERFDSKYFNAHYGIEEDNFVMLEAPTPLKFPDRSYNMPYELCDGLAADTKPWEDILSYVASHNLSNDSYYKVVADQIDIDSIIDLHVVNTYFGNADWPGNNVKVWRNKNPKDPSGMDTKWRFVVMDMDMGAAFGTPAENNFMNQALNTDVLLSRLMRGLLQNEGFKQKFIDRFVYVSENVFAPSKTIPVLDSMANEIERAMALNVARWPQNDMGNWRNEINKTRDFLQNRSRYAIEHLYSYFGIYPKEVSYAFDSNKVTLKVNNATVSEGQSATINDGQKLTLSATPKTGYTLVAINVTDVNGVQTKYTTTNPSITLNNKATVSILMRSSSFKTEPQIVAGSRSILVLNSKGDLYSWGSNENAQNGFYTSKNMTKPTLITTGVIKVSTSQGGNVGDSPHTLILTENNTLYSIGSNSFGQLGRSSNSLVLMKTNITGTIKDISAGFDHSIVLMTNGDLYGVGNNQKGQLGTTNFGDRITTFTKIASNVKEAAAGRRHTIYVDNSGRAYGLGDNRWNKLNASGVEYYNTPVLLMSNIKNVFAGEHSSFLIDNSNALYYLGWRSHINLNTGGGDGITHKILDNVKSVSMQDEHAMILTLDNKAYAWGGNSYSQVTTGTDTQSTPVLIASNVHDVAAGSWFSTILYKDGRVETWGKNNSGIAGNGTESDKVGKTISLTGITF